jgi:bifunctional UDP-N-acetylglucosamine pyrophosphorylase/glucosamine-1-phosphate N-acetyltransferase
MLDSNSPVAGIILAAGKGTRMKSDLPKGLHRVAGLPMVELVGRAMKRAGVERPIIVIGHRGEMLQDALGDAYDYVWQNEQLGTGHAALMAEPLLKDFKGSVVIAPGDAPLLDAGVFRSLIEVRRHSDACCAMLTAELDDPTGYGRVVRDDSGRPVRVVEQKDATPAQLAIREVNVSLYCFDSAELFRVLPSLGNDNLQGEYYLTDAIGALSAAGKCVATASTQDPGALVGVNDRWQLAQAESELSARILKRHAIAGVSFIGYESVRIEPDVEFEADVTIEGPTQLLGSTKIASRALIGPNTRIIDSTIGARTVILMSHVACSAVGQDVWIGPYANLRPGSEIGNGVRIGNFVETKNAKLADEAKVSHLSYVGDAIVGQNANVGAGVITANYDGFAKSMTTIGENAFVGSNSTLIAPVTIGDGAFVVAGSVITEDVPADAGAFGRARQSTKPGWAAEWRRRKKSSKI